MDDYENALSLSSFSSYKEASDHLRYLNRKRLDEHGGFSALNHLDIINKYNSISSILNNYDFTPTSFDFSQDVIFIVGMPRSGKTSLEHILSSTGSFFEGGENSFIDNTFRFLQGPDQKNYPYPQYLPYLNNDIYYSMGRDVTKKIESITKNTQKPLIVTEPINFLYIPLLLKILPQCKIIWCHREPPIHALNMYLKSFQSDYWNFTYDINALAAVFKAYRNLSLFYKTKMPDCFYTCDYRNMAHNTKGTIKDIFSFLEIDISVSDIKKSIASNKNYLEVIASENDLLENYLPYFPELDELKN